MPDCRTGSECQVKKRRFSINTKLQLLVILVVLVVSFGIGLTAYAVNVEQIDRYFKRISFNSATNFATFIDPDFFVRLRETAESEEFQAIRETAEQTGNESLIENYLKEKNLWEEYAQTRKKCAHILTTWTI